MDDVDLALDAARAGAALVRERFGGVTVADLKGPLDPVTAVDRAAEEIIVRRLLASRPGAAIIAEEGSGEPSDGGLRWFVDPLDGTVNFIHGIPQVGVSIALYEGNRPLVAVTIDALRGEEFVAVAGGGATLDGVPIRVSDVDRPSQAVVATGFPYDHDRHAAQYAANLGAVLAEVNGIRRLGSAVLDFAWVAAGRYDGYWEAKLGPWDMAAGILLVSEAGGVVTDGTGHPATPDSTLVVAGNPIIQAHVRQLLAGAGGPAAG